MEELMYEAADEILSNRKDELSIDVDDHFKPRSNTKKSPSFVLEDDEISSVEILRKTILGSIQNRRTKLNLYEDRQRARLEEFGPPSPKIEVKSFDEKLKDSFVKKQTEDEDHTNDEKIPVCVNVDEPDLSLTPDITPQSQLQNLFLSFKNKIMSQEPKTEEVKETVFVESKNKLIVENSLKLARRDASTEKIFENCSTYNMVYPEIILPRKNPLEKLSPSNSTSSNTPPHKTTEIKESYESNHGLVERSNSNGDLITLNDTFFSHMINGDYVPSTESLKSERNSFTSCPSEANEDIVERSSISSYSQSYQTSAIDKNPNQPKSNMSSGKKCHKKCKKNKKNRSKDPPIFDCPKCGVSYHITSSKALDMARCLHCDFWTSVEPVFLKREKQTWNTCTIS